MLVRKLLEQLSQEIPHRISWDDGNVLCLCSPIRAVTYHTWRLSAWNGVRSTEKGNCQFYASVIHLNLRGCELPNWTVQLCSIMDNVLGLNIGWKDPGPKVEVQFGRCYTFFFLKKQLDVQRGGGMTRNRIKYNLHLELRVIFLSPNVLWQGYIF